MISGNAGEVEGRGWNREEKEAARECNDKQEATLVNWSLIPHWHSGMLVYSACLRILSHQEKGTP